VIAAENGAKAWEILQQENAPDLLILDWMMPGIDGLELCRRIRERQRSPYQYILLVTGKDDKQDVVKGLEAGADDYLTKPFDSGELRARVEVGKRFMTLQYKLIHAQENLRYQATHDALTGIWSRAAILDVLDRELQRGVRSASSTGILMIDLDHFKKINDTYGHLTGDTVLKEAAQRINLAVRSYDFTGRYGGEEFLVVLSNCGPDDLRAVAERVRRAIGDDPISLGSKSMTITVSIGGVATWKPTTDVELLSAADAALYEAKRNGRNRVEIESFDFVAPNARVLELK
jgi:diguanylate cyclase (GGDEF)-like protein